ncbi:transposase [Williamsoniiplasma luminosum]|uniref:Transposase n=1 Tax=Williamsoniiplasma luminosum TaxID=214888 RepID=A0A2S0NJ21_9MOLU|nr:transposase [Williamsoniiplasma luminosum]AVP49001.1 MAG: hypothetical protein C5T88_00135 [Williamsoniiplasma luminosum]
MARYYSQREKENMILEFKNSNLKMRNFVVSYDISYQAFTKWVKQYDQFGPSGLSGTNKVDNQRIKELEKENKKLKQIILEQNAQKELLRLKLEKGSLNNFV